MKLTVHVFRALLTVGLVVFSFQAVSFQRDANRLSESLVNPDLDNRYQHLKDLSLPEIFDNDPDLASRYILEREKYRSDLSFIEYDVLSDRDDSILVSAFFGFLFCITFLPWTRWLSRPITDAVSSLGKIINSVKRTVHNKMKIDGIPIVGRENLKRFSTADELLKWKKLLDDGLITEEQFQEARQKLLNS